MGTVHLRRIRSGRPRRKSRPECEGCAGSGVRVPARPACSIPGLIPTWIVVERCDTCELFDDDLTAALSMYGVAGWFLCVNGGYHALARTRSVRRPKRR